MKFYTFKNKMMKKLKQKRKEKALVKAEQKALAIAKRIRHRISLAIAAGFGFVIALTWNDAIREGVNKIMTNLGLTGSAYIYKILTAVIVTIIGVIGIILVSDWAEKK